MNTNNSFCKVHFAKTYQSIPAILYLCCYLLLTSCTAKQNWEQSGDNSWESDSAWGDSDSGEWGAVSTYPVFEVKQDHYIGYETYPTRIEGIQDIEIRPKISAYIEKIYVDEGQFVKKGQMLFKLETNAIAQNTMALKEAIKVEEAAVKNAEAAVTTTILEVVRLRPLVAKSIISEVQLKMAESKYEAALASLESAQARHNQAKSTYKSSLANEDYSKIISPVSGYVGKLNFRLGSLVGPSDVKALTTLSNTKEVYAYFSVSENDFFKMSQRMDGNSLSQKLKGFPALKLTLADGTEYAFEGKLDASTGKISTLTGALQLRAIFDNPHQQLLSGSNGIIKIPTTYNNQIAIPASASFETQGQVMVYKLMAGDTLVGTPIKVKDKIERYFIIESGLKVGDKVLAQGVSKVSPNTAIKVQLVAMDSIVNAYSAIFK
jgi:membrane fusion protein (multidrug efflux system)